MTNSSPAIKEPLTTAPLPSAFQAGSLNGVGRTASAEGLASDAPTVMAIIDHAARDPNAGVDKLDRLIALYEGLSERQGEQAFNAAMNAAQAEMECIGTDAYNALTDSRYASLPALDRALRPIYTRHGFSLSYDTGESALPETVRVVCYVGHVGGHKRAHHLDMPADGKGLKP